MANIGFTLKEIERRIYTLERGLETAIFALDAATNESATNGAKAQPMHFYENVADELRKVLRG